MHVDLSTPYQKIIKDKQKKIEIDRKLELDSRKILLENKKVGYQPH